MNNRNKPRPRKGEAGGAFKEDRGTHQSLRDLANTAAAMTTTAMTTTMTTFTTEKTSFLSALREGAYLLRAPAGRAAGRSRASSPLSPPCPGDGYSLPQPC